MKRNRCKKIAAALLCMVMGCTTLGQGFSAAAADATTSEEEVEINFAKALQMSLYFYDDRLSSQVQHNQRKNF